MSTIERRQWPRKIVSEPELGLLWSGKAEFNAMEDNFFVGVHDISSGGFKVESDQIFDVDHHLHIMLYQFEEEHWSSHQAKVVWSKPNVENCKFQVGLELIIHPGQSQNVESAPDPVRNYLDDINFLLSTSLLEYIPTHAVWPLLNCFKPMNFTEGEQIITQGDDSDSLYVLQYGRCCIKINKDGVQHILDKVSPSDVVGEMGVLTDAPRCADVVAETDSRLWKLDKDKFEEIANEHPDLREFLTEIVAKRFENSKITADRTIGKYEIKHKLDQGGWGIVYQGIHVDLNMQVAVKMLKHQMAMDPNFQNQFKREAKIIALLNHRNIVQVYDIEEKYRTIFIIMEFLEGESLESLLKRSGILSFTKTMDILEQTCAGLQYAHQKGIVHHDIKPANIFVRNDGQSKILDFGLAFSMEEGASSFKGTIEYSAPEQIKGLKTDKRVDIYTLGLTAYEMVTGQRPWKTDDISESVKLRIKEDIPDPVEINPNVPHELRRFITKAGRCNPVDRYPDFEAALAELKPLICKMVADGCGPILQEQKKMSAAYFFYTEEQQRDVQRILEEVNVKAWELGVELKLSEIK